VLARTRPPDLREDAHAPIDVLHRERDSDDVRIGCRGVNVVRSVAEHDHGRRVRAARAFQVTRLARVSAEVSNVSRVRRLLNKGAERSLEFVVREDNHGRQEFGVARLEIAGSRKVRMSEF
jgi:hypothetical protein